MNLVPWTFHLPYVEDYGYTSTYANLFLTRLDLDLVYPSFVHLTSLVEQDELNFIFTYY